MDPLISPKTQTEVQSILNKWSNKLNELKYVGGNILKTDLDTTKGEDENLPFIFILRHTLEILDSISILIKNSSIAPCKILLRAMLENYLNLEYLSSDDWQRKAYQFIGSSKYTKLKFYKKLDKSHSSHNQFKKPFDDDKRFSGYPFKQQPLLQDAIQNLENLFKKKQYKPIIEEIQRLSKNKVSNPPWYRLFNGPKNLKELAHTTKLSGLYETYYRFWSGPVHGTNIIEKNFTTDDSRRLEVLQIRLPFEARDVSQLTTMIAIFTYQSYVNFRLPDNEILYLEWYSKNKQFLDDLNGKNPILEKK